MDRQFCVSHRTIVAHFCGRWLIHLVCCDASGDSSITKSGSGTADRIVAVGVARKIGSTKGLFYSDLVFPKTADSNFEVVEEHGSLITHRLPVFADILRISNRPFLPKR